MAPLNDAIITAVSQLVDDAQSPSGRRDPSHSNLDFEINRSDLGSGDPKRQGRTVGKAKRVREMLSWAYEYAPERGSVFVEHLLGSIRGHGGFQETSPNYAGKEAIESAIGVFGSEGYVLSRDGELRPKLLDGLSSEEVTEALNGYVRRAKKGWDDAALVVGTGKDLLEAVASHVILHRYRHKPTGRTNFPTLLGQAFEALDLETPERKTKDPKPQMRMERAMYELACGINGLRNTQGTGHGRPWLPTVTPEQAKTAIECMGVIAEYMMDKLASIR